MTSTEAHACAKERSRSGSEQAVIKALPGELRGPYYAEVFTTAIPSTQIVSLYTDGALIETAYNA